MSALFHAVEPRQARHHARPRPSRRARPRQAARRGVRRGRRELHAARARGVRPRLRRRARDPARRRDAAPARVRARRVRGATGPGSRRRWSRSPAWRGSPATRAARRSSPAASVDPMVGAHAALAIVAALEHRDRTGEGQLVEVPMLEVATAVTAEQVIRYSIDGTLARPARHRRRVPRRAATTRGSRSTSASDPMPADERAAWCATRDRGRRGGRARARPASRPRRWCPATRRSTTRSCRRAASSSRSSIRVVGRAGVPDVAGAHVGRSRALLERARADARPAHRRRAARRARRHRRRARRACATEHVIGTAPYFG